MDYNNPTIDLLDKAIARCKPPPKGIMISSDLLTDLRRCGRITEEPSLMGPKRCLLDGKIYVHKADLPESVPFQFPQTSQIL